MNSDGQRILGQALLGGANGGLLTAAGAVVSGAAFVSTPVRLLGLITLGITTSVSWPVVLAYGAGGVVVGALSGALVERQRQERIRQEFSRLLERGGRRRTPAL